jgi:hypothetical protein
MQIKHISMIGSFACVLAGPVPAATLGGIGEYQGTAGIGSANGVVTAPPVGENYVYLTTDGSDYLDAGLGLGDETNGSELVTFDFAAGIGSTLDLYFNYVTSDGAGYSDYAYVLIFDTLKTEAITLFTARTTTAGDTVPGFDLPAINPAVTLTPASTPIIAGGTDWDPLGDDSGSCWDTGCGHTGWISARYVFDRESVFSLAFGVVNWTDVGSQSGLAVAGVKVDDAFILDPVPAPVPLPAGGVLLLSALVGAAALRRRNVT